MLCNKILAVEEWVKDLEQYSSGGTSKFCLTIQ